MSLQHDTTRKRRIAPYFHLLALFILAEATRASPDKYLESSHVNDPRKMQRTVTNYDTNYTALEDEWMNSTLSTTPTISPAPASTTKTKLRATTAPSATPTIAPSVAPSIAPSVAPSLSWTQSPTPLPTKAITNAPVESPTSAPSQALIDTPAGAVDTLVAGSSKNAPSSSVPDANSDSSSQGHLAISLIIVGAVFAIGALVFLFTRSFNRQRKSRPVKESAEKSIESKKSQLSLEVDKRSGRGVDAVKNSWLSVEDEDFIVQPISVEASEKKEKKEHTSASTVKKPRSYEMHVDAIESEDLSTLYDSPSQKADEHYFSSVVRNYSVDVKECGLNSFWDRMFGIAEVDGNSR